MSLQQLPPPQEAYHLLSKTGEMFTVEHPCVALPNISYKDSEGNRIQAVIDTKVLLVIKRIYAADGKLRAALASLGADARPAREIKSTIAAATRTGIVWGFSGYATPSRIVGGDYSAEASAIKKVYEALGKRKPKLVIDGGVSVGVLGLSGVVAAQKEVETLGVIPLEGLNNIGPRTNMIVWGNTYKDREKLVGSLADILICIGGSTGTENECLEAIKQDGIAVLLAPRTYKPDSLPESFRKNKKLREAEGKQLFVCGPNDSISECIEQAIRAHMQIGFRARTTRLANIERLLNKTWL